MRITAAAPDSLRDAANHLAMCLAFSPADAQTYRDLDWHDGENQYAAASWETTAEWVHSAQTQLQRPAWDTESIIDMDAAQAAQAALVFWVPEYGEYGELLTPPPQAAPDAMTAIAGMGGLEALAAMGLMRGQPDPEPA